MPTKKTLNEAKQYYIKLTRKLPNIQTRVYKSEKELKNEIDNKKQNWKNGGPKCFKPTIAIAEQTKHYGKKCPQGQERTTNFCVKEINQILNKDKIRWYRTLSPSDKTRVTIACPK